jgi:hypothetical protein
MFRVIAKRCCKQFAPENLTLYLFTLSHSSITRDYWGDREALLQADRVNIHLTTRTKSNSQTTSQEN